MKGAPAKIVEKLSGTDEKQKENWLELNRSWAAEGQRNLFFAYRYFDTKPELDIAVEDNLEFLGAVGMVDPPREEVIEAIKECHAAGIKTVMITATRL